MKKTKKYFMPLCLMLILTMLFSFVSVKPTEVQASKAIYLSDTSVSLYPKQEKNLYIYIGGGKNKSNVWKSSNSKIVKIDSKGTLTAIAPGKATITAYPKAYPSAKCKCVVTVRKSIALEKYIGRKASSLAKAIGKMKHQTHINSELQNAYEGSKIRIEYQPGKGYDTIGYYSYIINKGNKAVSLYNVRIGNSWSYADKCLKKAGFTCTQNKRKLGSNRYYSIYEKGKGLKQLQIGITTNSSKKIFEFSLN